MKRLMSLATSLEHPIIGLVYLENEIKF